MDKAPRSVNAIVESQVQRWLVGRAEHAGSSPGPAPVITISREYGARGAAVARLVAERLGFGYWNRELLAAIAAHARLEPSELAPYDEHHRSALVDTMRGMIPSKTAPSQGDYARELSSVVREIVLQGAAVLVGRGLGFLIDPARCLRVRVVCPLEKRVKALAECERISLEQARGTIEYADRDRRAFVRDLFGREVDDIDGYDLWVSTGSLTLEAAADVVISGYRSKFGAELLTRLRT